MEFDQYRFEILTLNRFELSFGKITLYHYKGGEIPCALSGYLLDDMHIIVIYVSH